MNQLRLRRGVAATTILGALLSVPSLMHAQSVTTGAIAGVVSDNIGRPLGGVELTLTHRATGSARTVVADGAGAYRTQGLPPGQYDVRVEALGYRPVVILDVRVGPAEVVTLDPRLAAAPPPVSTVDTIVYAEGAVHASLARGTWVPGSEVVDLVNPLGRAPSLASIASLSSGGLTIAGLPDRYGVVGVDGMPSIAASHPGSARTDLSALTLPFTSLDYAEIGSATDVEWPGVGGDLLSTFSARPPRDPQLRARADATKGSLRGSLLAGGPMVRDTAWALLGIDARRLETSLPAPWVADSFAAAVTAVARDSFQTDLGRYNGRFSQRTDVITGFGRFDWAIANGQMLSLRAALANLSTSDFDLGPGRPVGLGSSLTARDVSASAMFSTRLTRGLLGELKLDVDRSLRDFHAPDLPGTVVVTGGLSAGADGALPGRFERNTTRFTGALNFRLGPHDFKLGVAATWASHDITYDPYRAGSYVFGSVDGLAGRRGSYVQSVGGVPVASFSIHALGFFGQDTWSPRPGLSIQYGMRIEGERWPTGDVSASQAWLVRTGVDNAFVPRLKTRLSPRFGLTWSAGPRSAWLLHASAGSYAESADPSVLAEVLTHDGAAEIRRGLGDLGAWPAAPDSLAAPVMGPALTLFSPGFESPRSQRVVLSLARQFGSGLSVEVAGRYRHTEFLPRRSDLNLVPAPQTYDQYGRPLYGTLQQDGAMLAAVPGSNRRFSDFDRVWAIDPSGFSDFLGLTVALERVRERGLSLWASYTYSQTKDNTPGLAGSLPDAQLSPFPGDPQGADWRDGRSDLDVPHEVALGAELARGGVRVIALLRYRSGAPFTPGFRDGVDANGDGAWGNDPAFISDTVSGMDAVLGGWSCLRSQVGRFAERNSCRGPAATSVDVRVVVRAFTLLGSPTEVVVDGLNLVSVGSGIVDRAVYLVDGTRALSVDPFTGVVDVPLVANPDFGKLRVKRSPNRLMRVGLRVGL